MCMRACMCVCRWRKVIFRNFGALVEPIGGAILAAHSSFPLSLSLSTPPFVTKRERGLIEKIEASAEHSLQLGHGGGRRWCRQVVNLLEWLFGRALDLVDATFRHGRQVVELLARRVQQLVRRLGGAVRQVLHLRVDLVNHPLDRLSALRNNKRRGTELSGRLIYTHKELKNNWLLLSLILI